jgi:hypothetical protein
MPVPVNTSRIAAEAVLEALWCEWPAAPAHKIPDRAIAGDFVRRHAGLEAPWSGGVRYNAKHRALGSNG